MKQEQEQKLKRQSGTWNFPLRLPRELRTPVRILKDLRELQSVTALVEELLREALKKEGLI